MWPPRASCSAPWCHCRCFGAHNAWKTAENYRELRRRGTTVRKTIDRIIATACIEANLPLLFSDRDFQPYVEHIRLEAA